MTIFDSLPNYAPWLIALAAIGIIWFLWFSLSKPCPRCGKRGQGEPYKLVDGEVESASPQDVLDKNFAGIKCKNCGHLIIK
ncbi:MAG: hypothetical protein AB8G95_11065 [Anaerolineae bacterium]